LINRCKICSASTRKIIDNKRGKLYHRCLTCDFIFLDESFVLGMDAEKKHYDNHHNNLQSLGYVKMFERLIDEFIEPLDVKSALDFGCGEGEVLPILLERREITCHRYDIFYFPKKVYEDEQYDLIVSSEVFEHLSKPLEVFKDLLSHLKTHGHLLLMTSFHPSSDEEFLKWYYIQDTTHICFFSMKTFEYLATKFNLKIEKHNNKNIVMFEV
jgi:SAM-dependent methyltransferase